MSNSNKKLELAFWAVLPGVITLLLLTFYLVPKHMSGLGNFMPLLFMIPMFYWGFYSAREMPYWFVFILGLLMDSANGQPLGLSSFLYVVFLALIHAQHKYIYKEGFVIKWGYFALLLGGICLLHWLLVTLFNSSPQRIWFALIQWFLTVCCYPLFHQMFDALHHHISQKRWWLSHSR